MVNSLPSCLRHLELDGLTSLLLPDGRSVSGRAIGCHIFNSQPDQVTGAQLAVDGEIEHRQLAHEAVELQVGTNGPDLFRFQGRFLSNELAFVPGLAVEGLRVEGVVNSHLIVPSSFRFAWISAE